MVKSDIIERMWTAGVPEADLVTDLNEVRPFRVSTLGERLLQREAMLTTFGLSDKTLIENPWGFPFIPLPVLRQQFSTGLMIAPDTITINGIGHPIYWIDPALTRRTEEEHQHPELWCIRMFYLIMAMGMWDTDTLRWVDVPRFRGVEYSEIDVAAYRQGQSSVFDAVKPLGEQDMVEPLLVVEAQTRAAIARCAELQQETFMQYRAELAGAYSLAVANAQNVSEWNALDERLRACTVRISQAVSDGAVPSSFVPEVFGLLTEFERLVKATERAAIVLSVPVLSEGNAADQVNVAATALKASRADVDARVERLRARAQELFSLSRVSKPEEFVALHTEATSAYMKAYQTLLLAARNLINAARRQQTYQSFDAMSLTENISSSDWPELSDLLRDLGQ